MRPPLVEMNMKKDEAVAKESAQARTKNLELQVQNKRLAEALRKAEFRIAIDASTARILALARGPVDADPEIA